MSDRPVQQIDATDWTSYYRKPFFLSRVTRPLGMRKLVKLLKREGVSRGSTFLELGGGNSCLYDWIEREFAPSRYVVADANELGLELLRARVGSRGVETYLCDLLIDGAPGGPYDVVTSIGLIEHFDLDGTRTLVRRHFDAVGRGAIVLMTFPTPTFTYHLSRTVSEALRQWHFPDERPLAITEVMEAISGIGEVLYCAIGRWTPFTQAVVVARKI